MARCHCDCDRRSPCSSSSSSSDPLPVRSAQPQRQPQPSARHQRHRHSDTLTQATPLRSAAIRIVSPMARVHPALSPLTGPASDSPLPGASRLTDGQTHTPTFLPTGRYPSSHDQQANGEAGLHSDARQPDADVAAQSTRCGSASVPGSPSSDNSKNEKDGFGKRQKEARDTYVRTQHLHSLSWTYHSLLLRIGLGLAAAVCVFCWWLPPLCTGKLEPLGWILCCVPVSVLTLLWLWGWLAGVAPYASHLLNPVRPRWLRTLPFVDEHLGPVHLTFDQPPPPQPGEGLWNRIYHAIMRRRYLPDFPFNADQKARHNSIGCGSKLRQRDSRHSAPVWRRSCCCTSASGNAPNMRRDHFLTMQTTHS